MSTKTGRQAEAVAAEFLHRQGINVLARNWRTRWCEIDIVAEHNGALYFVEAKYRSNPDFGAGLDYITPRKLIQMAFAAEFWLAQHKALGREYRLSAIELSGLNPEVTQWLPDVS
jgi:ribonuclease HII